MKRTYLNELAEVLNITIDNDSFSNDEYTICYNESRGILFTYKETNESYVINCNEYGLYVRDYDDNKEENYMYADCMKSVVEAMEDGISDNDYDLSELSYMTF